MQLDLVFVHSLHSKAQQHPLTSVLHTLGALKKVCIKRKMLSVEIILSAHAHTLDSLSLSHTHAQAPAHKNTLIIHILKKIKSIKNPIKHLK